MAKKTGSRKKKTATKRKKASVKARKPRKPTRAEAKRLPMFKDMDFASIFVPEVGCDANLQMRWRRYLTRAGAKKR